MRTYLPERLIKRALPDHQANRLTLITTTYTKTSIKERFHVVIPLGNTRRSCGWS
jgi:hypothetical protein